MYTTPAVRTRSEDGSEFALLVWQFADPVTVASTASCGGGIGARRWVVNAQVAHDYSRHDLQQHADELASVAGLHGPGVVMFTAADVRGVQRTEDGGVHVDATVGLTHPAWAAGADDDAIVGTSSPGTINIVALIPVQLSEAALLNALCTATEAKTQALLDAGVAGTGTPSDAIAIACTTAGPVEQFAGPRSAWGARLARAVHTAVRAGAMNQTGRP